MTGVDEWAKAVATASPGDHHSDGLPHNPRPQFHSNTQVWWLPLGRDSWDINITVCTPLRAYLHWNHRKPERNKSQKVGVQYSLPPLSCIDSNYSFYCINPYPAGHWNQTSAETTFNVTYCGPKHLSHKHCAIGVCVFTPSIFILPFCIILWAQGLCSWMSGQKCGWINQFAPCNINLDTAIHIERHTNWEHLLRHWVEYSCVKQGSIHLHFDIILHVICQ